MFLPNSSEIRKNNWEIRIISLFYEANVPINGVYEIGTSLSTSESYDYDQKCVIQKITTQCVINISVSPKETKEVLFQTDQCPWLRIETAADQFHVVFRKACSNTHMEEFAMDVIMHFWIRRTI